jgi:hypothetical protein
LPAPQPANLQREAGAVPVGIGSKQLSDLLNIYGYGLLHAVADHIKKRVSPAKMKRLMKLF